MPAALAFALGIGGALAMLPVWLLPGTAPRATPVEPVAAIVPMPVAIPHLVEAPAAAAQPVIDMAAVVHEGGLRVIVDEGVDPAWLGEDLVTSTGEGGPTVVTRPLSDAGQAVFARFRDRSLALSDAGGVVCRARITDVEAYGRYYPDWDLEDPPQHGLTPWQAVADHWSVSATLVPEDGECESALWARDAAAAPATYGTISSAPAELARRAAAQVRDTADFHHLRLGQSEDVEIASELVTTGGERLLVTTVSTPGCVDMEPSMTALYRVNQDGELRFMGSPGRVVELFAAADSDGDGHAELLFADDTVGVAVMGRVGRRYAIKSAARVLVYGCRC